jgi:prepilin-type processing-associated H-X9-DG protein/prepilin-type N-terminal cleavage/methylation domain-containing protein
LAFTLVELLVVLAIIALLVGLLLPTLNRVRASGRSAKCRSNLHQIALALRMYVDDNNAYPFEEMRSRNYEFGWKNWVIDLAPSFGLLQTDQFSWQTWTSFHCPEQFHFNETFVTDVRYGYNTAGTSQQLNLGLGLLWDETVSANSRPRAIKGSDVQAPSDMIAVGCITNWHAIKGLWSDYWIPAPVHSGRANVLFCDAHVESGRRRSWAEVSERALQRWNNDNHGHPETWPTLGQ